MVNPFLTPVGGSRRQFTQPQNQFDFSGWGDRLGKIEEGIAGLTEQFNDFQAPGDVEPEYLGNAAPEPLEQTANETGIESLVAEPTPAAPAPMESPVTPMGGQAMAQAQTQSLTPPPPAGGMGQLGRHMTYQPGQEGFTPLTAEQFASQQDLFGRRQDYSKFSGMASDVTGMGGGIGGLWRKQQGLGGDARFGHAYEDWQDYAAGYGGSDPSQGMENWMQDYNFDLAPKRPQFNFQQQIQPGQGPGGFQSGMADYAQSIQEYESSPEYLEWKQREEARGPLSESTTQAMGGQNYMGGPPDINPYISMGMAGGQDPTYESYMEMVNQAEAGYRPQSTAIQRPPQNPYAQSINPLSQAPGAGITALAASRAPALQGPVQQQIQQGLGSLSQGAGV